MIIWKRVRPMFEASLTGMGNREASVAGADE